MWLGIAWQAGKHSHGNCFNFIVVQKDGASRVTDYSIPVENRKYYSMKERTWEATSCTFELTQILWSHFLVVTDILLEGVSVFWSVDTSDILWCVLYSNSFVDECKKKQGCIHGVISRMLLGRGSNKAIYTSTGAHRIITDRLQRWKSLIVLIRLVFVRADGPMDQPMDGPTDQQSDL